MHELFTQQEKTMPYETYQIEVIMNNFDNYINLYQSKFKVIIKIFNDIEEPIRDCCFGSMVNSMHC